MAKKKKELTLEEKLENALVPESEQPYKIPDNWVWTRLGEVCIIENGYAFKSDKFSVKEGIPIVRISNIRENIIDIDGCINTIEENIEDKFIIKFGDLLIALSGATTGKNGVYLSEKKAYLNQRVGNIKILDNRLIINRFRDIFIKNLTEKILESAYGGAQPNISGSKIGSMLIPLPPIKEQQRIVDRIESLFSKLDEAKEKIQQALDSFENRKSAILYKAFSGELTKKWREENGVSSQSWIVGTLQSVCTIKITDGTHQTPKYTSKEYGIPFLSAKDVISEKIDWSNIKYITEDLHEELYKRVKPQLGDVLLAKNGTTGVSAIVDVDKIFDIYVTLALLRADRNKILPEFLHYLTNSPICRLQFKENLTGIGVPNLHLRDIRNTIIKYPRLEEQKEIVRILDNIFEKEIKSKELIDLIEKIEFMKKSILSKSFRGELGTNNPEEGSAIELLKEVLKEK